MISTISNIDTSAAAPVTSQAGGAAIVPAIVPASVSSVQYVSESEVIDYASRILAVERRIEELELRERESTAMILAPATEPFTEGMSEFSEQTGERDTFGATELGGSEVGEENDETIVERRIQWTEACRQRTRASLAALASDKVDPRIEAVIARVKAFKEAAYPTVTEGGADEENQEAVETGTSLTGPSEAYLRELARWGEVRLTAKFEFLHGPTGQEAEKMAKKRYLAKVISGMSERLRKRHEARRQKLRARWVSGLSGLSRATEPNGATELNGAPEGQ